MKRTLRFLSITIELNLLLWLAAFAALMKGEMTRPVVIAGLVFAALAQHWAYYAVRKAATLE